MTLLDVSNKIDFENFGRFSPTYPVACAHKSTATAIFKPVSRAPISQWRKAGQPARVIPHVDCAMLSQFYVYYRHCTVGAMSKLYLYNITVLNC